MGKMVLYHGSTVSIEHPLANVGREDLDFGKGFYLTTIVEQARQWAARVQLIKGASDAVINVYELDWDELVLDSYKILKLEKYDRQWLDFIVASRNGEKPWMPYDIVEGGVANDKVIDTVEDYISGTITVEQALGQLIYAKPNHQICLLNQSIIDRYLYFMESYVINV